MLSVKCLIEDLVAVYNAVKCLFAVYDTAYGKLNCNLLEDLVALYNTVMLSVAFLIAVYDTACYQLKVLDCFCLQSWFRYTGKVKFVKHAKNTASLKKRVRKKVTDEERE